MRPCEPGSGAGRVIDAEILAGKPVVRGTRLAAELAAGQCEAEILACLA